MTETIEWFGRGSSNCVGLRSNKFLGTHEIVIGNGKSDEVLATAVLNDSEIEILAEHLDKAPSPTYINMRKAFVPEDIDYKKRSNDLALCLLIVLDESHEYMHQRCTINTRWLHRDVAHVVLNGGQMNEDGHLRHEDRHLLREDLRKIYSK